MTESMVPTPTQATPNRDTLVALLQPQLTQLQQLLEQFRQGPVTPQASYAFENQVNELLRQAGRALLAQTYNQLEPPTPQDCPQRLCHAGQVYRRRPATPNTIATLFGPIVLRRYRYEALEAGEPSLFPLELQLGIEAGLATPALAEQVGLWAAEHEQCQVLALLQRHHQVRWSVTTLRKLTGSLSAGLASFRQHAQVQRLLQWLGQAQQSRGRRRPVLAAGRDGVMVPMRQQGYQEGASATVSVYDRRGRRLGTVYLGHMPEPGQPTLSAQLTALLEEVLRQWQRRGGPPPRLAYVTDKGHHQQDYYRRVLRQMADPWRPGQKLVWEWVLDFFHVAGYVGKLAEALFANPSQRWRWFGRMRRWLRDRPQGVANVLRSACQHLGRQQRPRAREQAFWQAYRFLRHNARRMHYAAYRRRGLPIGSGVTEAACKTVFAQRLKRSGMSWAPEGGQVVVQLRVLVLSGVWQPVHDSYLRTRPLPVQGSYAETLGKTNKKAA